MKSMLWAMALISVTMTLPRTANASSDDSTITFEDVTQRAGIDFIHNNGSFGKKYLPETMGPGVGFIDYDNDGWPDVFIANGHINEDIQQVQSNVTYAMSPQLFHNVRGNFQEVTKLMGTAFTTPRVGRGAAYADINNDGRLDLLLTTNNGPASLFENA